MSSHSSSSSSPQRRRPVPLLAAALLSLATAVGSSACSKRDAAAADSAAAAAGPATVTVGPENVTIVRETSISSGPAISGTLAPEKEAMVRAELSGSVVQTYVEAGQRVSAGAPLARIDASAIADAALSARSALSSAQAQAELAKRNLERNERLLAAGAVAERDIEASRSGNVAAQAALADARARLSAAQQNLGNTRPTAPFAGIVSERAVNAGDVVAPGAPLFTVVDPRSMRLEASVPAAQLAQVKIGAPVRFTVTGYPGRLFEGRITRVNPLADAGTGQVRILASVPNAQGTLVGGLFAEGRVTSDARTGLVVPVNAVDQRGVSPTITRVKGGRAERVTVKLGLEDQATETVEVIGGIAAGDTVLVGAAQAIDAGVPVKVGTVRDAGRAPAATPAAPAPTPRQ